MIRIALLLMLGLMGVASAQTSDNVVLLQSPPGVAVIPGHTSCEGSAFNADSSVVGACRVISSTACSGRGCQPVTLTTTYVANWDAAGTPLSAVACKVVRHHLPQADAVTYAPGYDATTCPSINTGSTGTVVVVDGFPFYYVTTGPDGAELLDSQAQGYLFTP